MYRLRMPLGARAVVALVVLLALAGCTHTVRVGGHRHLDVALTEYRVTPDTVRAYAGTLTITVRNAGTRVHNLALSLDDVNVALSPDIRPGSSTTMTLYLTPGKYTMRSTITDDQSLGLWGTLDVVATRKA